MGRKIDKVRYEGAGGRGDRRQRIEEREVEVKHGDEVHRIGRG